MDRERAEELICRCRSWEPAGEWWPTLFVLKTLMTELAVPCPLKPGPSKAEEHEHMCLLRESTNTATTTTTTDNDDNDDVGR